MKTTHSFMCFSFMLVAALLSTQNSFSEEVLPDSPPAKDQSIMLALLLDTSNSMDGLIGQAKSQLWKIVNELAAAKCDDGSRPNIKKSRWPANRARHSLLRFHNSK